MSSETSVKSQSFRIMHSAHNPTQSAELPVGRSANSETVWKITEVASRYLEDLNKLNNATDQLRKFINKNNDGYIHLTLGFEPERGKLENLVKAVEIAKVMLDASKMVLQEYEGLFKMRVVCP